MYIPNEYWFEQGKIYEKEFVHHLGFDIQERTLIEYLQRYVAFSTVLEVGCGFGRITKLLLSNFPKITKYVAIDLSPHQIESAKRNVNGNVEFIVSDIQSFHPDSKYDLVLASEVLLHILPSEIKHIISTLLGWSRNLVHIDWFEENPPERVAPYNFNHQYEKIYHGLNTSVRRTPIIDHKGFTKQSIFHAKHYF